MEERDNFTRELLDQSTEWSTRLERLENKVQKAAMDGAVLPLEVFSLIENLRLIQFELHHRINQVRKERSGHRSSPWPGERDMGRKEFRTFYNRALTLLPPD